MAWIFLIIGAFFETGWAVGLKYTEGFSRLWPSVFTVIAMALSFHFLSQAMKTLPVGTAYAVWTGLGAVGTAVLGMVLFGESREWLRILCLLLIFTGVIGLKFITPQT
ncbi:quaternary ammonium compound efflux SMR transporter SugE [Paludifilum halophilum]|uniref:QacE family quaternary ammonium compound efflux SMR transporter n=1 Tax=Paludifilum halophilum TaxID=1642702 RepID=A0A235BAW2_9BACL|nr:quaternary ammonium compound efflux SMR transporter SugE [Paludifilum halophilum]OYD09017.1 QacE family quaternary ammonium compound efflux SMR transporter [Paludifilum halophilum]